MGIQVVFSLKEKRKDLLMFINLLDTTLERKAGVQK